MCVIGKVFEKSMKSKKKRKKMDKPDYKVFFLTIALYRISNVLMNLDLPNGPKHRAFLFRMSST